MYKKRLPVDVLFWTLASRLFPSTKTQVSWLRVACPFCVFQFTMSRISMLTFYMGEDSHPEDWCQILKPYPQSFVVGSDAFLPSLRMSLPGGSQKVFTPLRVGGPPTPQAFLANSNIYTKNQTKTFFFSVFLQCVPSKNTVIYAVFGIKSVQDSGFCSVFKALASKKFNAVISPNP